MPARPDFLASKFQLDFIALFSSKSNEFIDKVKQKWFHMNKNLEYISNNKNANVWENYFYDAFTKNRNKEMVNY